MNPRKQMGKEPPHKHLFKITCGTRRKVRFSCSACKSIRHYDRDEIRHRLGIHTWAQ